MKYQLKKPIPPLTPYKDLEYGDIVREPQSDTLWLCLQIPPNRPAFASLQSGLVKFPKDFGHDPHFIKMQSASFQEYSSEPKPNAT